MKHNYPKFRNLSAKHRNAVANQVKLMLAAHRDCLWSKWNAYGEKAVDPTTTQLCANEGYYGEAFGIMRGLICLGYGYFGPDNLNAVDDGRSVVPEHNLKWWFNQLLKEYLIEEGWYDKTCSEDNCAELLDKYRKLVRA